MINYCCFASFLFIFQFGKKRFFETNLFLYSIPTSLHFSSLKLSPSARARGGHTRLELRVQRRVHTSSFRVTKIVADYLAGGHWYCEILWKGSGLSGILRARRLRYLLFSRQQRMSNIYVPVWRASLIWNQLKARSLNYSWQHY